ncbi:MAG: hypothetical protein R3362_03930 [Rhodothermales bacterium]|nr:hypothetical protein [Rhodothermales bacterium]
MKAPRPRALPLLSGAVLFAALAALPARPAAAQLFDERVVDVGNVGLTVTNAGFVGNANIRNNPTSEPPSFEYPLDSGVEHLFESGLWVGAVRADGQVTVRTGAITTSGGYRPGGTGFEFIPEGVILERSSLPESESFSPTAVSQQDYVAPFTDNTAQAVPPIPDSEVDLGIEAELRTYAWSFPFTEYFVIWEVEITNTSQAAWDSVFVGMWHDLVVRNVLTTTDAGGDFFNKNGIGFIGYPEYAAPTGALVEPATDSMFVTYAFNAGGEEESLNTYGGFAFLGAEWTDPATGEERFFHPFVAEAYVADGYPAPRVNPRWWLFGGGNDQLARPNNDLERYQRMAMPYPNPVLYPDQAAYEQELQSFFSRLRTDGANDQGNWIGLTPVGPFPRIEPGQTVTVTFAAVAALKPEAFQGVEARPVDTEETRTLFRNNVDWAMRTYAGEDADYDGELDPGEDVNGNGELDRYLIPEPPASPNLRVEVEQGRAVLYWDESAEVSRDPITGVADFEGYRIYQSAPGDDRLGNIFANANLVAQYDSVIVRDPIVVDGDTLGVVVRNAEGYNIGFDEVRLDEPVTFPDDEREYWYRFEVGGLLDGWQYAFAVTAFDEGDPQVGLPSFESSRSANAVRAFPGTPAVAADGDARPDVGVFPNPYTVRAAWSGEGSRTQKLYFYNLPARADVRVYTLAGEIVDEFRHDATAAADGTADIRWFEQFSGPDRVVAGGLAAWDLLSQNTQQIATGMYLFSVRDLDTGETQTGKFVLIR